MQWIGAFGALLGLEEYERFAFGAREPPAGAYQRPERPLDERTHAAGAPLAATGNDEESGEACAW